MTFEVEALTKKIGGQDILKGLDLHIKEKQFVGILGPNGSGKSTLLKCMYRVLSPDLGQIKLHGKAIQDYTMRQSARLVAVVEQHHQYDFDFTVEDIVLMGRSPYKSMLEGENAKDYEIVYNALKQVGLLDYKKRNFATLSGGEQQRVVLARALAQETACIILDEPTNHLDIKYQLDIMRLVSGQNRTILAAIHDLNIAAMYSDYIYLMKDGKVITHGTPREVLTPENIKLVYEIDAKIYIDEEDEMLHILYKGM